MQKCSYCGRDNDDALAKCCECGTELSAVASAPDAPSSPRKSCRGVWIALLAIFVVVVFFVFFVAERTVRFDSIEIRGTRSFAERVIRDLKLLRARSPQGYEIVTNYIGVIVQDKRTGMAAYETPPTAYLRAPEWESTTSLASGIAHESIHSQLYNDYLRSSTNRFVPDKIWTGEAAEKFCCEHQMRVLKEIGAPLSEIAYYTWNPSNRYWEIPYEQRNW